MPIQYYYTISAISLLCVLASLLYLVELDLISKKANKRFRIMDYLIIGILFVDVLYKTLEADPNTDVNSLYVVKAIELSLSPILPYLIFKVFKRNNTTFRRIQVAQEAIIVLTIILQVASLYGRFIFYINDEHKYARTPFTVIYIVGLILSVGLLIFAILSFSKRTQKANAWTLLGVCFMICAGFFMRLVSIETNFAWLCISISMLIINMYYVSITLRLDPLTQLLNRQVYNSLIEQINFSTLIIVIDANNFKSINDTFGHESGDRTLRSFAKCILKVYGEYAWCFRTGGDEYCVVFKREAFKRLLAKTPRNDAYRLAKDFMDKLDEVIRVQSEDNDFICMQYGVSQGFGIYYDFSDDIPYFSYNFPNKIKKRPIEDVIKLADERLYKNQEELKSKCIEAYPVDKPEDLDQLNAVMHELDLPGLPEAPDE